MKIHILKVLPRRCANLCLLNCWVFFSYYPKSHYCVEMTTCMQPNNSCKLLSGSVILSKLALKNVALLYFVQVSTCMGCVHYIWSKVAYKIWNIQDLNWYISLKVCFLYNYTNTAHYLTVKEGSPIRRAV